MPLNKKKGAQNDFFSDVYAVVRLIPKGRVTSYGAIATYLGLKSSARMVGWAMHACPKGVPAHRVVNSAGMLSGKHAFKTPTTMTLLLKKEGVAVKSDKIQRFKEIFWDPTRELEFK